MAERGRFKNEIFSENSLCADTMKIEHEKLSVGFPPLLIHFHPSPPPPTHSSPEDYSQLPLCVGFVISSAHKTDNQRFFISWIC